MNKEKKYLTLEEAEKIVDDMYQKRWEECGVEVENTIYMGNLDKLEYTELEKASLLLLRTELRLKRKNKQLKEQLETGEQQYNHLVEEKEELQEQLSSIAFQLEKQKKILDKANKKIEKMFHDGDEYKVIDNLIELQKILDIDKGE